MIFLIVSAQNMTCFDKANACALLPKTIKHPKNGNL